MKKLDFDQMESSRGGEPSCSTVMGAMCGVTAILVFSTVFAPLAGATGVACLVSLACPD